MDETLILAILVIIIALCIYVNSRRLPRQGMRPMTYGDVNGVAAQKLYYPKWADALRELKRVPDEKTVVSKCTMDPMCAAIAYTTRKQQASRIEGETPTPAAYFWPYTLDPATNTMYYHPTDDQNGPDLFVKHGIELTSWYPEYAQKYIKRVPRLIDPRK